MICNPFVPGTFWECPDGRRYMVTSEGHFARVDIRAVAGRVAPHVPDMTGAVQLQLVPVTGGRP